MADMNTKLSDLIDPEVMGDMVSARIPKKLRVAPLPRSTTPWPVCPAIPSRCPPIPTSVTPPTWRKGARWPLKR